MSIVYKNVPYVFYAKQFWGDIRAEMDKIAFSDDMWGELLEISPKSVKSVRSENYGGRWMPTIRTFLRICHELDLTPTDYFGLDQSE